MTFSIKIYSIDASGNTKEVCWNEYNAEWIGQAYTSAWAKRLGCAVVSHVVHLATGASTNFNAGN